MDSQSQTVSKPASKRGGRRTKAVTKSSKKNTVKTTVKQTKASKKASKKVPKKIITKQPEENVENKEEKKEEKTASKKKKSRLFETYIAKTLKNVAPDNGITANAKQQVNSAACFLARQLSSTISRLTVVSGKKTLSEKEVSNATRVLLPPALAEAALEKARSSVENFTGGNSTESKHTSRQDKAGIVFPPSIAEKFLRNFGLSKVMVTKTAPVVFAAVLEHIVTELLSGSGNLAKGSSRVRITIRELELTVRTHPGLNELWRRCSLSFVGGGVVPGIHASLLVKKPRKKRKVKTGTDKNNKKTHRFRPGTVSLREIKKFQKASNCLTFAKFPFERSVRGIVRHYQENMKISKDVFTVLQYYIEQTVVDFLRDANNAAIHAGRVKLMASDVNFIHSIRGGPPLDVSIYKESEAAKEAAKEAAAEETTEVTTEETTKVTSEPVKKTTKKPVKKTTKKPVKKPAPVLAVIEDVEDDDELDDSSDEDSD